MNELLSPFLLLVQLGVDPYPGIGRTIDLDDAPAPSTTTLEALAKLIAQRQHELDALRLLHDRHALSEAPAEAA